MFIHLQFPPKGKFLRKKSKQTNKPRKGNSISLERCGKEILDQKNSQRCKVESLAYKRGMEIAIPEYIPEMDQSIKVFQLIYNNQSKQTSQLTQNQEGFLKVPHLTKKNLKFQFQIQGKSLSMNFQKKDYNEKDFESSSISEKSYGSLVSSTLSSNQSVSDDDQSLELSLDLSNEENQFLQKSNQFERLNIPSTSDLFDLSPIPQVKQKKVKISSNQKRNRRQENYSATQKLEDQKVIEPFNIQLQQSKKQEQRRSGTLSVNCNRYKLATEKEVEQRNSVQNLEGQLQEKRRDNQTNQKTPLQEKDVNQNCFKEGKNGETAQHSLREQNVLNISQKENCNLLGEKLLIQNERKIDQNIKALESDLNSQQQSFQQRLIKQKMLNKTSRSRLSLDQFSDEKEIKSSFHFPDVRQSLPRSVSLKGKPQDNGNILYQQTNQDIFQTFEQLETEPSEIILQIPINQQQRRNHPVLKEQSTLLSKQSGKNITQSKIQIDQYLKSIEDLMTPKQTNQQNKKNQMIDSSKILSRMKKEQKINKIKANIGKMLSSFINQHTNIVIGINQKYDLILNEFQTKSQKQESKCQLSINKENAYEAVIQKMKSSKQVELQEVQSELYNQMNEVADKLSKLFYH